MAGCGRYVYWDTLAPGHPVRGTGVAECLSGCIHLALGLAGEAELVEGKCDLQKGEECAEGVIVNARKFGHNKDLLYEDTPCCYGLGIEYAQVPSQLRDFIHSMGRSIAPILQDEINQTSRSGQRRMEVSQVQSSKCSSSG